VKIVGSLDIFGSMFSNFCVGLILLHMSTTHWFCCWLGVFSSNCIIVEKSCVCKDFGEKILYFTKNNLDEFDEFLSESCLFSIYLMVQVTWRTMVFTWIYDG